MSRRGLLAYVIYFWVQLRMAQANTQVSLSAWLRHYGNSSHSMEYIPEVVPVTVMVT